ncbi:hypothetical protein NY551_18835 [Curtobacterium flaccumfaciens pv. oortii]|uniref:hypothetical protein n=1 Tax=Curtobacterium flaccumfaciens TaxID=2035 RepID=UPI002658D973|nr:hypothetical protein [Curtobacterium flaccumfaciens]MCS5524796.1 hypothetical protein [Curtobacterium flaccumfaciens pv. oortii]
MTAQQTIHGPGAAAIRPGRNTTSVFGSGGAVVVPQEIAVRCPIVGRSGTYSN